jgi:outer membrane biosynthesis protein TonB
MDYHRGPYIQRGRGIGSIFRSIGQFVLPAVSTLGKNLLSSPITKSVLKTVKNSAIDAGLNLAADTLAGKNIPQSLITSLGKVASDVIYPKKTPPTKKSKPKPKPKPNVKKKPAQKRKIKGRNTTPKKSKWEDIYEEFSS